MFIDRNSIIINGVSMGQYLISAKYEHNKLWASDTGRNMAGKMMRYFNWNISKTSFDI